MSSHTRRQVLAIGGATAAGVLTGVRPVAAAPTDLSDWFENVGNANQVIDKTGQSTVEILVGAEGNGGAFAFAPAAVRVDPGSEVVWKWTGDGGSHNVVASDGSFESDLTGKAGATFKYTASDPGVYKYFCTPHKTVGMKGALIVGDQPVTLSGEASSGTTPTQQSDSENASAGSNESGAAGETTRTEANAGRDRNQPFSDWLGQTDDSGEIVDWTGQDVVTISVGAKGNGGRYAFDPPVVRVSEGTTVVWEWMTDGIEYQITERTGEFASEPVAQVGHRYGIRFTGTGVWKYESAPHTDRGMRGVIIVVPDRASAGDWGVRGSTAAIGLLGALYAGAKMLEQDDPSAPN